MSNVVPLRPITRAPESDPETALIAGFAKARRPVEDVFWLKENAELLGILAATGTQVPEQALAPYQAFYDQLEERFNFFPQYYRFLLAICLDLEDLGMAGRLGERLCAQAAHMGLAEAELSDLQRGEARRLLARRGLARAVGAGDLGARLRGFISRSATFALPNKKAAYELTHIVYYLSEYGRVDPDLPQGALTSLNFAGLMAYLEQNMDLLGEVCAALRCANQRPSPIWENAVAHAHGSIRLFEDETAPLSDAYHAYFVTGWSAQLAGKPAFAGQVPMGALRFAPPYHRGAGVLRVLSAHLMENARLRRVTWDDTRRALAPMLGQEGHEVLESAVASSDQFEAFFDGFARNTQAR